MLPCCGLEIHAWEKFHVEQKWLLKTLRCFIVGENPSSQKPPYFYEIPESYENDPVDVRRGLFQNLFDQNLLKSRNLEGFRDAGFLFDHAIRCRLPRKDVEKERRRAKLFNSQRVKNPAHLFQHITQAPIVSVMGHLASNAVANITTDFPKEKNRKISFLPFPGEISPGSKFFLSSYLSGWNEEQWENICKAFGEFEKARGVFGNSD